MMGPVASLHPDCGSVSRRKLEEPLSTHPSHRAIVIAARHGWGFPDLRELVAYREVLAVLCWRDIAVRYKQSAIGIAWALLQPVGTMVVFSVIFGGFAHVASDGIPYPVFAYAGLLPWLFFQRALTQGSNALVGFGSVLTKVYFPRVIAPIAAILTGLLDFAIAFAVLVLMMLWYGIVPGWPVLLLPGFLALVTLAALGASLWLSVLNVEFRDIQHALPFLTQVWMFATPVVYPTSLVPEAWRPLYALNPVATVVEGFRWTLLGGPAPRLADAIMSLTATAIVLIGGLAVFDRFSRNVADRI
jgi:lipopolysaccharide transport system permease protein